MAYTLRVWAAISQSIQRHAMGWKVGERIPVRARF